MALSSLVHTYNINTTSTKTAAQNPRPPVNDNAAGGDEAKALSAAIVGLSMLSQGDRDLLSILLKGGMVKRLVKILKTSKLQTHHAGLSWCLNEMFSRSS